MHYREGKEVLRAMEMRIVCFFYILINDGKPLLSVSILNTAF